jgi:hypothetical protein
LNQIYVDGVQQWTEHNDELIDHNQAMSTGLRRLTVQAKDSTGAIFKDTHFITVCSRNTADTSVTICSPSDGSMHISPVHVTAAANSTQPVQYMQIYVDGEKAYEVDDVSQIDTNLELAPGNHQFTVQSNNGATFNQTIHFDVCALNATGPSVTICTPQDEAAVGTTVRILAAPTSSTPVRLMQI